MQRMRDARRVSEVHVAADFSYRSTQLYGDRWLLAGDAAGFVDRFSAAVFSWQCSAASLLPMRSRVLDQPRKARRLFPRYENGLTADGCIYLRFVNAWYTKESSKFSRRPARFESATSRKRRSWWNIGNEFAIKMADVGVLFSRLAATTLSDRSQTHARAGGKKKIASS